MSTTKKIAILATNDFEDMELSYPLYRLQEAGYVTELVSPSADEIKGKKGYTYKPAKTTETANVDDYVGLIVPGGYSPDHLRLDPASITFVEKAGRAQIPIGAICHGPWLLASARLLSDCTVTSFPSIQDDLKNAGAEWTDRAVVVSNNLVTSRKPDDLPEFMKAFLEVLQQSE